MRLRTGNLIEGHIDLMYSDNCMSHIRILFFHILEVTHHKPRQYLKGNYSSMYRVT